MNDPDDEHVWFVGDLDDPWVVAIADALPASTTRLHAPDDLPEPFVPRMGEPAPAAIVLHRAVLTRRDAARIGRFRASCAPPPRVVLCFGPHTRYIDLERWSELVDAVLPEATAREIVARRIAPAPTRRSPSIPRPRIAVVSTNSALRLALSDACEAGGYSVQAARDWSEAPPGPAVWDVPMLEPGWIEDLSRRAKLGPVVALMGFADRASVSQARAHGAFACLDLPVDPVDLVTVLDRVPSSRPEPAHELPPPPVARRRGARRVAERRHDA